MQGISKISYQPLQPKSADLKNSSKVSFAGEFDEEDDNFILDSQKDTYNELNRKEAFLSAFDDKYKAFLGTKAGHVFKYPIKGVAIAGLAWVGWSVGKAKMISKVVRIVTDKAAKQVYKLVKVDVKEAFLKKVITKTVDLADKYTPLFEQLASKTGKLTYKEKAIKLAGKIWGAVMDKSSLNHRELTRLIRKSADHKAMVEKGVLSDVAVKNILTDLKVSKASDDLVEAIKMRKAGKFYIKTGKGVAGTMGAAYGVKEGIQTPAEGIPDKIREQVRDAKNLLT